MAKNEALLAAITKAMEALAEVKAELEREEPVQTAARRWRRGTNSA